MRETGQAEVTSLCPPAILCMKWGSLYGAQHVNALARGITRHLDRPHRIICFTDDPSGISPPVEVLPLPDLGDSLGTDTRWRKLTLWRRDLGASIGLTGSRALFLDLDLVIVGDLGSFFDLPGAVRILRDDDLFRAKALRRLNPQRHRFLATVGNSSVFRFTVGAHPEILQAYVSDPAGARARYEISQQFQSAELARRGLLDYWPRGWCVSFKNDCVPRGLTSYRRDPSLPEGARIVVFAGSPKMDDVFAGAGHRWHRRIGSVDWLRDAWTG